MASEYSDAELREKLEKEIDEVEWQALQPHEARGAVVVVSPELDLIDTGVAIAQDRVDEVKGWLDNGRLARPEAQHVEAWNNSPERRFRMLILQPYVLIQERAH